MVCNIMLLWMGAKHLWKMLRYADKVGWVSQFTSKQTQRRPKSTSVRFVCFWCRCIKSCFLNCFFYCMSIWYFPTISYHNRDKSLIYRNKTRVFGTCFYIRLLIGRAGNNILKNLLRKSKSVTWRSLYTYL